MFPISATENYNDRCMRGGGRRNDAIPTISDAKEVIKPNDIFIFFEDRMHFLVTLNFSAARSSNKRDVHVIVMCLLIILLRVKYVLSIHSTFLPCYYLCYCIIHLCIFLTKSCNIVSHKRNFRRKLQIKRDMF